MSYAVVSKSIKTLCGLKPLISFGASNPRENEYGTTLYTIYYLLRIMMDGQAAGDGMKK